MEVKMSRFLEISKYWSNDQVVNEKTPRITAMVSVLDLFINRLNTDIYNYLTGSYPLPPQGLQERILLTDIYKPLKTPCFLRAWMLYSEQVGVYLQALGSIGDSIFWYNFTRAIRTASTGFFIIFKTKKPLGLLLPESLI